MKTVKNVIKAVTLVLRILNIHVLVVNSLITESHLVIAVFVKMDI